MSPDLAGNLAIFSGGFFFLAGLVCGLWKYVAIARSETAEAPTYVDVAHRAGLMYAFACVVIERFVALSDLSDGVEVVAVALQVGFFALALLTYVIHGVLRDTDNQLARPHRLGAREVRPAAVVGFMVALSIAEIGGFAILMVGAA